MHADWQGLAFELADWKATGTYILRGGPVDEAQVGQLGSVWPTQAARRHPSCDFFLHVQCTKPNLGVRVGCCSVCMSSFLLGDCCQVPSSKACQLPVSANRVKMQEMDSAAQRVPGISPGCARTSSRLAQGCTSWLAHQKFHVSELAELSHAGKQDPAALLPSALICYSICPSARSALLSHFIGTPRRESS